jgi:hypothetical protein
VTTVPFLRRPGVKRLIAPVCWVGVIVATLAQLNFFLRPGLWEVLRGLAQHGYVLALLLLLAARSRSVSLSALASFWFVGLWTVFFFAYLAEAPFAHLFGADASSEIVGGRLVETSDTFVPDYWSPFVEESLKLAPIALYLWLQGRRGFRQPSMSDGLLIGFMVGAGVSFHEDAHVGKLFVSGAGWDAEPPWTVILPTVSPVGDLLLLNHAIWGALSGLSVGVAMMFRHRRWAWFIAAVGPSLSFANHAMGNHFSGNVLGQLGRADVPWQFSAIRDLTADGRLPFVVLLVGALAVAVGDRLILRSVERRTGAFRALSATHLIALAKGAGSLNGIARLGAAERYTVLRRLVYFGAWRMEAVGRPPKLSRSDLVELTQLFEEVGPSPGHAKPAEKRVIRSEGA